MRTSTFLLAALPVLVAAEPAQAPLLDQLKGWWAKATASISSALPSVPTNINLSPPNPVAAGAAKLAAAKVEQLTINNYKDVLRTGAATASPGHEEWMILVTGGNKTCFGGRARCIPVERAFNESLALMAVSRTSPNYGYLNCETDGPLCSAWSTGPPSVVHMLLPQPKADQTAAPSIVRYIPLNATTVTASEIAAIHLQQKYKDVTPDAGFFHPFDGFVAKNGLSLPVGYALWAFSQVPSWAFMIFISFVSRTFMSRRMPPSGPRPAAGAAAPAART